MGESNSRNKDKFTGMRISDVLPIRRDVNYQSNSSLTEDHLVNICIATVFIWIKIEEEERAKQSNDEQDRQQQIQLMLQDFSWN